MLDPYFARLRDAGLAARPPQWQPALAPIREGMARETRALAAGPQMRQVIDHAVPRRADPNSADAIRAGTNNAGTIALREFVPDHPKAVAAFIHGGGWAAGGIDDFDALGRALAQALQAIVLLPDYRLAPEHPYPAGLEDVQDALRWMGMRATQAGLPLIGLGDSAGANLLLAAALELGPELDLKHVSALYPVTDCDFDTRSYRDHGSEQLFTAQAMRMFFALYAPPDAWSRPTISIARHPDLARLPEVLVMTCGYDLLCEDGVALCTALKAQGRAPDHLHYESAPHGFLRHYASSDLAAKAIADLASRINATLHR